MNVYKKTHSMCCMQEWVGNDEVLVGFMFQWELLVIVDMTEHKSLLSNSNVAMMSQSGGRT